MDFSAIFTGLKLFLSVHRWTKKCIYLWNYCVHKPTRVLVLGVSGSGKTQFLTYIIHSA